MSRGAPEGARDNRYSGFNDAVGVEQLMLVVAYNSDLTDLTNRIFEQFDAMASAHGGEVKFTSDELMRYFATALKVRTEHVLKQKWRTFGYERTLMSVHDEWALVIPLHSVLSSLGKVTHGPLESRIMPVWDPEGDELILTAAERDRLTAVIRMACKQYGVPFESHISKDLDGHAQVMLLTPVVDGWWSWEPVSREDAAAAMVTGLQPATVTSDGRGAVVTRMDATQLATALAYLPTWVPPYVMKRHTVIRYIQEMADVVK